MTPWRHESKQALTAADCQLLRSRLRTLLRPDPYASGGAYTVRSLYFDTPTDKALREKLDGVDRREKYRLRLYNGDTGFIRLEKKVKQGGLGCKVQAVLAPAEVAALLRGELGWMPGHPAPLVRELYARMRCQGLGPRTLVIYRREPYVFDPGGPADVRVTLDSGLRTGLRSTAFLDPGCLTVPAPGPAALLEVKWDRFLPQQMRAAVQLPLCRPAAFSKYAACRMYDYF